MVELSVAIPCILCTVSASIHIPRQWFGRLCLDASCIIASVNPDRKLAATDTRPSYNCAHHTSRSL
eukprot:5881642-Pyramimonas_sp.AAC.3